MKYYLNEFVFGYYPYISLTVFLIGCIFRYEYDQYSWKTSSSQLLRKDGMFVFSNLFHFGIILLFFGHFFGLLTPSSFYSLFISHSTKQMISMFFGGIFGVLCFFGLTFLIYRRLFDIRINVTSSFSDIFILIIKNIQLILGLISIFVSSKDMSGVSMMALAHWVQHIVTFQENAADLIINEHIIFKLHLFLGLTIFLIFPFTRLVHILSLPIKYLFRDGYQVVRSRIYN